MDEILNHGYVSTSRARRAAASTRDVPRAHAPFALDEPVQPRTGGWEWDTQNNEQANDDFDNRFDDFPDIPRRRVFHDHPATKSELAGGLCPPLDAIGGHEIVGHHITRQGLETAAAGVPNYAPNPNGNAAYEPSTRPSEEPFMGLSGRNTSPWQTSAQAAMSGAAQTERRRTGKRMAPRVGSTNVSTNPQNALHRSAFGFGTQSAPFSSRQDIMHRNVDIRGGRGVEILPFVPGYGGYVPETRNNFNEAAKRNLAKRPPKELLVENHNPRMSGCTKASTRPF